MRELWPDSPGFRDQRDKERLVDLAERQGGVVHRDQLVALGFTSSAIARWEAGRRIHRLYPAVFALGHRALDEEARLRAGLMYAGKDAALSHLTAVSWWDLLELQTAVIHVSTPAKLAPAAGLVVHARRRVRCVIHRDLCVTPGDRRSGVPETRDDRGDRVGTRPRAHGERAAAPCPCAAPAPAGPYSQCARGAVPRAV